MLLIVPHPDDEVLLGAGIVTWASRLGLPLHVCVATNGDYGCADQTVGRLRLRESLNALEYLGLSQEHVTFLGYADTGMPEMDSFLQKLMRAERPDTCVPSPCGVTTYGLPGASTWHMRRFGREASYCRRDIQQDLRTLLEALEPDTVLTTSLEDTHFDHSALCRFVMEAAAARPTPPAVYQGVVHSLGGDERWPLRDGAVPFTLPEGVEAYTPVRFPLPPNMWDGAFDEPVKRHALRCHVTAMKPDAVDFLSAFVKADELFFLPKENAHA